MMIFAPTFLAGALLASSPGLPSSAAAQEVGSEDARQVVAWTREGQAALAAGRLDEALDLFVRAHVLAGETKGTHVWILRTWIEQGRINDAFNQMDKWVDEGYQSPGMDYVLGMAFHARAKDHIASNVPAPTVQRNFEPAAEHLTRVTQGASELFPDAWAALAEALWFLQRSEEALPAIEQALLVDPERVTNRYLLAQVLFTLYLESSNNPESARDPEKLWESARLAYRDTLARLAEPQTQEQRSLRSRADMALAHLHLWKDQADPARDLLTDACAQDPAGVNYQRLYELVTQEKLTALQLEETLREGARRFIDRVGKEDTADARLQWWLGFLTYERARVGPDAELLKQAEQNLLTSVAEDPSFHNAWYYAGQARYLRGDYDGMIAAYRGVWAVEPANLIGMLSYEPELSQRILDFVLGWCAEQDRALDAAFLCEVRVEFDAKDWERWNDLGLFSRNAGRALQEQGADEAEVTAKWERAVAAYARAYVMAPDKPHLLNDRAVVLQYDLKRDLDQARELYEATVTQARKLLAGELDAGDRELTQKGLDDALANLAVLDDA